jgi:hypothetical protein
MGHFGIARTARRQWPGPADPHRVAGHGAGTRHAALGLLVVAALGGFYLASLHLRGTVAPKAVVFVHAGVAVAGFLTLLSAVLVA